MLRRVPALFAWCYLAWILITWTRTTEQLLIGAAIAAGIAVALAPLGHVAGPWRLLRPRSLPGLAGLVGAAAWRILRANVSLARRIWTPSLPLRSGMVIVPTRERSAAGLTTVGLITSVVVDNQLVDLDPSRAELQYHAVDVPEGDAEQRRDAINGPIEGWLDRVLGGHGRG